MAVLFSVRFEKLKLISYGKKFVREDILRRKKEVRMINGNQVKFGEFIFTTGEIYL